MKKLISLMLTVVLLITVTTNTMASDGEQILLGDDVWVDADSVQVIGGEEDEEGVIQPFATALMKGATASISKTQFSGGGEFFGNCTGTTTIVLLRLESGYYATLSIDYGAFTNVNKFYKQKKMTVPKGTYKVRIVTSLKNVSTGKSETVNITSKAYVIS